MRNMTLTLFLFCLAVLVLLSCGPPPGGEVEGDGREEARMESLRKKMVEQQIQARGVNNPKVLSAMLRVPRHKFVPPEDIPYAYSDQPLPIGEGQTISQPYIVALMTENLELNEEKRVLEIGTGSGYQTAILAEVAGEVYSIEII
jgi:protein-L-isoaspartate(D-aspartate) O-methyltransferase